MSRSPTAQPWTTPRDASAGAPVRRIVYQSRAGGVIGAERSLAPAVATVLVPDERLRVDAAGCGLYTTTHRDSVDEVAGELRARPAGALLVSTLVVARGGGRALARVAEVVREFPAIPAVALVSGEVEVATVFALGRCGVRAVVDVRRPDGWAVLRGTLAGAARPDVAVLAASALTPLLADASSDVQRFVRALFEVPPTVGTVRDLARGLGVLPTTLMSRFFRARLPAPKRYLAFARLTRAAYLLRNPAWTVAAVADHLEYSSAQSFSRHLHLLLGVRPAEFRRRYDTAAMLARFGDELIMPYAVAFRDFWPLRRD